MGELYFVEPDYGTLESFVDSLLRNECEHIKREIRKLFFERDNLNDIENVVRLNHKRYLALSFRVLKLIGNVPDFSGELFKDSEKHLLKISFLYLETIIQFFEQEFFEFIEKTSLIPYQTSLHDLVITQENISEIVSYLPTLGISSAALTVLSEPLILLSSINLQRRINYQQLVFCLNYLAALKNITKKTTNEWFDDDVINILIHLNQNSIESFDFITNVLRILIEDLGIINEKKEFIRLMIKLIKQKTVIDWGKFKDGLPVLKNQIIDWLVEELVYWEATSKNINHENFITKVSTPLSVAELGLFTRLQYESGLIKISNQRELVRMVVRSFSTEKTQDISFSSLLSKYYNIEMASKKEVKFRLKKMIDLLDKW